MIDPQCTEDKCAADRYCTTCGRIKAPIGRSIPLGMYRCDSECLGYRDDPYPPHLWPNELRDHRDGLLRDREDGTEKAADAK